MSTTYDTEMRASSRSHAVDVCGDIINIKVQWINIFPWEYNITHPWRIHVLIELLGRYSRDFGEEPVSCVDEKCSMFWIYSIKIRVFFLFRSVSKENVTSYSGIKLIVTILVAFFYCVTIFMQISHLGLLSLEAAETWICDAREL